MPRIHDAWLQLVAPFWIRVRTLLAQDIDERSRTLANHGLRRVLGELDPRIRRTKGGVSIADRSDEIAMVGERGLVLMPTEDPRCCEEDCADRWASSELVAGDAC